MPDHAMTTDVHLLHERVNALERAMTRQRRIAAVLALLAASMSAAFAAQSPLQTVRADSVEIVGKDGKPKAILSEGANGGATLGLFGAYGDLATWFGSDSGGGEVRVYGRAGKVQLSLRASDRGGTVSVNDAAGVGRVTVQLLDGDGMLGILGADRRPKVLISVEEGAGNIIFSDAGGKTIRFPK